MIAADAGGTSEVVEHEVTGLLVPVGDAAVLQAAVERLWREPALGRQLSAEAARQLQAHFNFDAMMNATEAVLALEAGASAKTPQAILEETR